MKPAAAARDNDWLDDECDEAPLLVEVTLPDGTVHKLHVNQMAPVAALTPLLQCFMRGGTADEAVDEAELALQARVAAAQSALETARAQKAQRKRARRA